MQIPRWALRTAAAGAAEAAALWLPLAAGDGAAADAGAALGAKAGAQLLLTLRRVLPAGDGAVRASGAVEPAAPPPPRTPGPRLPARVVVVRARRARDVGVAARGLLGQRGVAECVCVATLLWRRRRRRGFGGDDDGDDETELARAASVPAVHPAWTAHRSPCGSGMNSCMGSVDALVSGCSARPSPARAGRFMGARRGRPRGELKNIGYFIIIIGGAANKSINNNES